jgi:hypothetical protein
MVPVPGLHASLIRVLFCLPQVGGGTACPLGSHSIATAASFPSHAHDGRGFPCSAQPVLSGLGVAEHEVEKNFLCHAARYIWSEAL